MEFDSPEAAKEFPGLYLADSGMADDSLQYTDDGDKKKSKKEKKKDKEKGYSALAAESSQEEDDPHDPKSPGKSKKIKAFSKLSGKKKEKDKKSDKAEKEQKKEKESKEKRKSEEKDRKSLEKELSSTPVSASIRPQIPFSGAHLKTVMLTPQSSIDVELPPDKRGLKFLSGESSNRFQDAAPSKPVKEKSTFNVFLNAPAPLLSKLKDKDKDKDGSKDKRHKKEKEHKEKEKKSKEKTSSKSESKLKEKEQKEKEKKEKDHSHPSGMAKVKLKLMRSKNSLDDSRDGDVPIVTSHQFPEDPEALAKEIKKYEGLLENAHSNLKSTKKISKKQEEQLWELQRTLTQLKRKLRSINALSSSSAYHSHVHSTIEHALSDQAASFPSPIFKKCDSIDTSASAASRIEVVSNEPKAVSEDGRSSSEKVVNEPTQPTPVSNVPRNTTPQEIPKLPMPPSKNSFSKDDPIIAKSKIPSPLASTSFDGNSSIVSNDNSESLQSQSVPIDFPPPEPHIPEKAIPSQVAELPVLENPTDLHQSSISEPEFSPEKDFQESAREIDQLDESFASDICNQRSSPEDSKESILAVVDDANKMIDSMHEELIFESTPIGESESRFMFSVPVNGTMAQEESDDVELFTNDLELDPDGNLPEEPCPDPFRMPVFDTSDYMIIENEALALFSEELKEEVNKEHRELEELLRSLPVRAPTSESESSNTQNENDITDLAATWTQLKNENAVLWDNVNRLRLAVAACSVDEFRLRTRLRFLESKASTLSPVTTTTPLQTEG